MKVMVTGGTGFIGSYIVEDLVSQGDEITIFARDVKKVSSFVDRPGIRFVEGQLRDREAIRASLEGQDACVHVALGWGETAYGMAEEDTVPSLFIFETAAELGVRHVVYTSSIAVFGDHRDAFTDDTMPRPTRLYGATKAATESYLLAIGKERDMQVNVVRPGYTFGPPAVEGGHLYGDRKIKDFVLSAREGRPIHLPRQLGTQFIWAGDLALVYRRLLASTFDRRLYTAVSKEFVTWEEVARMAVERCRSQSDLVPDPAGTAPADGRNDVSAIETDLGLSFVCREHLRAHVDYLAEHL